MHNDDVWTVPAGGALLAVGVLDAVLSGPGFDGLLVVGPVVASATLSPRRTFALAVAAVIAAVAIAAWPTPAG
ncbi:MAG: hypothetical protein H0T70_03065 [Acidimicrobiia bacterium]|nr:hypothetical protein [Acidimicrobiia bacterium]